MEPESAWRGQLNPHTRHTAWSWYWRINEFASYLGREKEYNVQKGKRMYQVQLTADIMIFEYKVSGTE